MRKLFLVPLLFLVAASLLGLLLRWHQYDPIDGFIYPFWLHAHSHTLFLGWIFNIISIAFISCFIPVERHFWYSRIIWILNALVLGMFIAFPLQGYAFHSILLSTLHTLVVAVYTVRFMNDTRDQKQQTAVGFARLALWFFLLSAIGPFALGALVANGLGHTHWYTLSIYYYLHFQYNGVFTFAVFALLYRLLATRAIPVHEKSIRQFKRLLFITCIPAFILSTLWTQPGNLFNVLGFLVASVQLVALYFFIRSIKDSILRVRTTFSSASNLLLSVAGFAFVMKLILQLLSALPAIARLAVEVRYYVIAYLHLIFIGMLSFFLLVWYREYLQVKFLSLSTARVALISFFLSEFFMLLIPQTTTFFGLNTQLALFFSSCLLVLVFVSVTFSFFRTMR